VTVYALAISPDGKLVAMARGGDVLVDDVASGQRIVLAGRGGDERALAFSPSGRRLAFGGLGGSLRLWDRPVGASSELPGHGADVVALAFAGDDLLASVARDGTLRLTRIGAGAERQLHPAHAGEAFDVAATPGLVATSGSDGAIHLWSPDGGDRPAASLAAAGRTTRLALSGTRLAALVDEQVLRVWDVDRRAVALEARHDEPVGAFVWLANDVLASGDEAGSVWIWDLGRGDARRLVGHEDGVLALAAAGDVLLSAGRDHAIRLWDPSSGASRTLLGHAGDVIALTAAGPWIASASRDRTVRIWRRDEAQPRAVAVPPGRIDALAAVGARLHGTSGGALWSWAGDAAATAVSGGLVHLAAAGPRVAAASEDGRVVVDGAPFAQLDGPLAALALDPRGRLVAAGGARGVRVLGEGARVELADPAPAAALAFAPGGSLLASAGPSLRLMDVERHIVRALPGGGGPFTSVAFSPDGRHLAAGGADGVIVWNLATGQPRRLPGPGVAAPRVAFAGDGRVVATGADRAVRVWELGGGEARPLAGLTGAPAVLAVAPGARSVAAGSSDGSVRLWDVGSGRGRSLGGHAGAVTALVFAADGRTLASGGEDGALRLWPDELPHDPDALRALLLLRAPKE
jgi:WD40 repeat protein